MKKLLKWLLSALYGLVMIEIIVMVSPFAFYWYAIYAPMLQGMHRWKATAWLEAFFLPHAIVTTSPFLEFLRWEAGPLCFSLGIIGFLFCAAQVYRSKFLHRGVVHSWIYSRIRHPQYLCLGVAGIGLLTMWPRIIILVLYAVMLIAYYFLARLEEQQLEAKHSDYAAYRQRTAMFIPGNPGGKIFGALFGWIPNRSAALAASCIVVFALCVGGALLLRRSTINHAATALLPDGRTLAIAIWPMPADKIESVVSAALRDTQVRSALEKQQGAVFTVHVLPADYGMVEMFADLSMNDQMFGGSARQFFRHMVGLLFPFLRVHHEAHLMGTPSGDYELVFSRVDGSDRHPVPLSGIAGLETQMTPVVIADVAGEPAAVQKVVLPPPRDYWGDITMPMF